MSEEGKFLVFCMECYRAEKDLTGREVSELFTKYGVSDYVMQYFDSLHTTGVKYIVADIADFIRSRAAYGKSSPMTAPLSNGIAGGANYALWGRFVFSTGLTGFSRRRGKGVPPLLQGRGGLATSPVWTSPTQ